jgi:signal transducing adaptor molecule
MIAAHVSQYETLSEPTAAEIARQAEQEATVFAQTANVDQLLTMRNLDISQENIADNEEILYRSCTAFLSFLCWTHLFDE